MGNIKNTQKYETQNVDLATFLIFNEIKLLECYLEPNTKVVTFEFLDEKRNCLDLERIFLNSDFKRFRDINKWLLKKVHQLLKEKKENGL